MTARYIDIHVLQSVPYANLNRDDLGSPKSMRFGGADRTRVSSQCWKRAVREAMQATLGESAVRTRRIPTEVAKRLVEAEWPQELATYAGEQIAAAATGDGLTLDAKTGATTVLLYLPKVSLDAFAQLCMQHREALEAGRARKSKPKKGESTLPKDEVQQIIASRNGIINLFGRMLAELPSSNVDGAVQVAHAFTVHGTDPEIDFFTAVDDLNLNDDTGSAHMNVGEFSTGTFYRYASINLADLTKNLAGDTAVTADLAEAFLTAFITAMPSAKQNATAAYTVPDLVYVAVRSDRPVSLASAFEQPVSVDRRGGFGVPARRQFAEYAVGVSTLLGDGGRCSHAHAVVGGDPIRGLGELASNYRELVSTAVAAAGLR